MWYIARSFNLEEGTQCIYAPSKDRAASFEVTYRHGPRPLIPAPHKYVLTTSPTVSAVNTTPPWNAIKTAPVPCDLVPELPHSAWTSVHYQRRIVAWWSPQAAAMVYSYGDCFVAWRHNRLASCWACAVWQTFREHPKQTISRLGWLTRALPDRRRNLAMAMTMTIANLYCLVRLG